MTLKKHAPWMILLTALSLVLSACGGGAPAAQTGGEATAAPAGEAAPAEPAAELPTATTVIEFAQEPAAGQKTIVWMTRTNNRTENVWQKEVVLPAYAKEAPDVFVKVLNINQDDIAVKREAMIAAKEPLHVWSTNWGGDGFASDRYRGLIQDLTPLIERDNFDLSDFLPDVLAIYESEGKQWGIPFLTTGSYVYYNKKLFDDAGVPYPPTDWNDKSWTWDAYIELAKKLTKNTDDINTAVFGTDTSWQNLEGPPMQFGHFIWPEDAYDTGFADKVTVSDEKSIQAFQTLHDLIYVHKVAPDAAANQAMDQLGGAFQSGKLAMNIEGGWGHWVYRDLIDDPNGFCWGAAPLPWGSPDADVRAVIYTDPWVITAGMDQENTDLAWNFVKFLASKDIQASFTNTSGTPPVRASLLQDYYKLYEKCTPADQTQQAFEGAFPHGRESSNHMLVRWDELNTTWNNLMTPFFDDPEGKAADVLPQVEAAVNEALARINEERK